MQGVHLTADLGRCDPAGPIGAGPAELRALSLGAVADCGLTPVGELFHAFDVGGVTGVVLLAESHLALHTWPELGAVTIDVYVCNVSGDNSARAEALMQRLLSAFAARRVDRHRVQRGTIGTSDDPAIVPTPCAEPVNRRRGVARRGQDR